ncbi:MAG TPA: VCBS repeat-containing protein, partial [Thermoleophilia bacterium]
MTRTLTYGIVLAVVICLAAALCALGAGPAAALSFTPPVHYDVGGRPADIASADVNKDGRLDLVTSAGDGISVLIATGPGRFGPATHVVLEHRPGAIAVADFDGDGALDIVTASHDGTVTVLQGDGAGVFITKGTFPTGPNPTDVVVGDVTGDGVADVATADRDGGGVSILKGDGAGGLLPPLDLPVGDDCSSLLGEDFDQDGTMDLAYTRYSWEEYAGFGILLADGAGGFTPMGTYETGGQDALPSGLALGELNGDETPDIAVLQSNEGDGRI